MPVSYCFILQIFMPMQPPFNQNRCFEMHFKQTPTVRETERIGHDDSGLAQTRLLTEKGKLRCGKYPPVADGVTVGLKLG
jgi:hypothetical protein